MHACCRSRMTDSVKLTFLSGSFVFIVVLLSQFHSCWMMMWSSLDRIEEPLPLAAISQRTQNSNKKYSPFRWSMTHLASRSLIHKSLLVPANRTTRGVTVRRQSQFIRMGPRTSTLFFFTSIVAVGAAIVTTNSSPTKFTTRMGNLFSASASGAVAITTSPPFWKSKVAAPPCLGSQAKCM
jgi:hypothetical protein